MSQNIILNHQEIEHKTKRIAYQIYETFVDEKEIVIAGIASNGYVFAQKIAKMLKNKTGCVVNSDYFLQLCPHC